MPQIRFRPEFVPFVVEGSKPHTIRKPKGFPVGAKVDLFDEGMNRVFGRAYLTTVQSILITLHRHDLEGVPEGGGVPILNLSMDIHTGFVNLDAAQIMRLTWNEGFRQCGKPDLPRFVNFLREWGGLAIGKPFVGELIAWKTPIMFE